MKATVKLIALASLLMLWSCSKTEDNVATPDGSSGKAEQVQGNWSVTSYFDSGKNETSNYGGYIFAFSADGSLSASSGSGSYAGIWHIGDKSSDDDNSSNRLVITITGNKQMDDLTDDWVIVSIDNSSISLKDDNPASMEYVTFSKK